MHKQPDGSDLDWTIQELRIYNGALSAAEIAATDAMGPGQLLSTNQPLVNASVLGGNMTLSWPVTSAGYSVLTSTNLTSGNWSPAGVAPQIVNGKWQVAIPVANSGGQYYRLGK